MAPETIGVSELTRRIKAALEGNFGAVDVEGEISGWKVYPSGHAYFTLKDEGAQIGAVMFAGALNACVQAKLFKDGAKVKVRGGVSVYPPRGNYQLVVRRMKLLGEGDLMQKYLELKAKLQAEGLFDSSRKRTLPYLPKRIGICTSEAGAVIHDMVRVFTRRFPRLHIRLFPCVVQGAETPASVMRALAYFAGEWRPDLIVIARGGGSFEDLFAFNDEALVRAIAASPVPTVAAIGHESDFTLAELAADRRAGTPSIAAEISTREFDKEWERLTRYEAAMKNAIVAKGEWFAQRLDHLGDILASSLSMYRERAAARFERAAARLSLLSPYAVLDRGYALVTASDGSVVKDAGQVAAGDELQVKLHRGELKVTAKG